jgi:hypothetical protein
MPVERSSGSAPRLDDGQRHVIPVHRVFEFPAKTASGLTGPTDRARISFASRAIISRSDLVPIVFAPRLSFCTSPQTLVTVPFFSYADEAGSTTSARVPFR